MTEQNAQQQLEEAQGAGVSRMPRQVTENANAAEELHAKLYPASDETVPAEVLVNADTELPASETALETAPVEVAPTAVAAPVVAPGEGEVPVEVAPSVAAVPEVIDWEARYNTINGKYIAEVPRMANRMAEMQGQINLLKPTAEPAPVIEQPVVAPAMTPELEALLQDFDPALVNGILNVMRAESNQNIQTELAPVREHVVTVEEQQTVNRRNEFNSVMDDKIDGDWGSLFAGSDPGFLEFLNQPDASGLHTYGQLCDAFSQGFDADRMAIVVNTYLATKAPVVDPTIVAAAAPTPETVPVAQPAAATAPVVEAAPVVAAEPTAQQKLADSLIAPETSVAPRLQPVPEGQMRIWTPETQKQFEKDHHEGKMYSAEESEALWNDLLLSQSQGRYRLR